MDVRKTPLAGEGILIQLGAFLAPEQGYTLEYF